jgi:nicotinamidase-related amidase
MSDEKSEVGTVSEAKANLRSRLSEMIREEAERRAETRYSKFDPSPRPETALSLEPRRTAIVVIDLQKGIVGMPGGAPHAKPTVIANAARLLSAARAAGAQPVLVHVGGALDGADRVHTPTDQPMRATGGLPPDWSELIPDLDQQPGDIVVLKRQWGAFYGTDLDLHLRRRGLTTIILCGIATEFGVESTARDAHERGYELIFAEDAMTGQTAESHANSTTRIFPRIGRVRSTEEILAALNA